MHAVHATYVVSYCRSVSYAYAAVSVLFSISIALYSPMPKSIIVLQNVWKQGIRFWDERTFWHEMIYKSLILTFGKPSYIRTEVSHK